MKKSLYMFITVMFVCAGTMFFLLSMFGDQTTTWSRWYQPAALACICIANLLNVVRHKNGRNQ